MATLPLEIWIMILDIVIEEDIVRLDRCAHITFSYHREFLSPGLHRYRFYGSYHRLRLVCRSFTAMLGTRPYCDLDTSSFPFPMSIRALRIVTYDGSFESIFQQLLEDTPRCDRLVCLDLSCWAYKELGQLDLSEFFSSCEGGAFPAVRRLNIWLHSERHLQRESSFWTRLHRAFPRLVTLFVGQDFGRLYLDGERDKVVIFEQLEILYFGQGIIFSECQFPHLRHASIEMVSNHSEVEIFRLSPHLESLHIRDWIVPSTIDVGDFPQLRVLSFHEECLYQLLPLDRDHPLEHLWLSSANTLRSSGLMEEISKRTPGISRITIDTLPLNLDWRSRRIRKFERMKLDSFGLSLRPVRPGDILLVIERSATVVKEGIWKKVWRNIRR